MNPKYFCDIKYSKLLASEFRESEWWWVFAFGGYKLIHGKDVQGTDDYYPALHTDLLLERLPESIYIVKCTDNKSFVVGNNFYTRLACETSGNESQRWKDHKDFLDKSLPNALASMLIWLKDQGLINGMEGEG